MRAHPHLYEINTWPWLEALSRRGGRRLTLGAVPDAEWSHLQALGIDLVYLMGIFRRSAISLRGSGELGRALSVIRNLRIG